MLRALILGAVTLATSIGFHESASAQHVVSSSECNSGNCYGGHGHAGGMGGGAAWISHSTWGDYWARNQAAQRPWHGGYYYLRTGQPTALVVPPTVTMQSNFSWGVSQNTMTPVYHQFGGVPPNGAGGGVFRATPYWPTHTEQFGVYPVRGPW